MMMMMIFKFSRSINSNLRLLLSQQAHLLPIKQSIDSTFEETFRFHEPFSDKIYQPIKVPGYSDKISLPSAADQRNWTCKIEAKVRTTKLRNVIMYRKRRMKKHKKKKWLKEFKFVLRKVMLKEEKEVKQMEVLEKRLIEERIEKFDAAEWVQRELEKAKYAGYKCPSQEKIDHLTEELNSLSQN